MAVLKAHQVQDDELDDCDKDETYVNYHLSINRKESTGLWAFKDRSAVHYCMGEKIHGIRKKVLKIYGGPVHKTIIELDQSEFTCYGKSCQGRLVAK